MMKLDGGLNVTVAMFDEPQVNPWARISEIATRVGVPPHVSRPGHATVTAIGADGKRYDVFAVVAAVLDRIDAAAPSP